MSYDVDELSHKYDRDPKNGQWIEREPTVPVCPECGGELGIVKYGPAHEAPYCLECEWTGDPE